uniref:Uncharacterized protein n=1 Tax=Cacopsylla melanoneura TaxID=428564 RepID=A0A8D9B2W0_9HEMI
MIMLCRYLCVSGKSLKIFKCCLSFSFLCILSSYSLSVFPFMVILVCIYAIIRACGLFLPLCLLCFHFLLEWFVFPLTLCMFCFLSSFLACILSSYFVSVFPFLPPLSPSILLSLWLFMLSSNMICILLFLFLNLFERYIFLCW